MWLMWCVVYGVRNDGDDDVSINGGGDVLKGLRGEELTGRLESRMWRCQLRKVRGDG
jgi:hypothetical protein